MQERKRAKNMVESALLHGYVQCLTLDELLRDSMHQNRGQEGECVLLHWNLRFEPCIFWERVLLHDDVKFLTFDKERGLNIYAPEQKGKAKRKTCGLALCPFFWWCFCILMLMHMCRATSEDWQESALAHLCITMASHRDQRARNASSEPRKVSVSIRSSGF